MAAQAAIAAGGAAVDVAKGLFNEMNSRTGRQSARSMQVVIRNTTSTTLTRSHYETGYGEWTKDLEPPYQIGAKMAAGFMGKSLEGSEAKCIDHDHSNLSRGVTRPHDRCGRECEL
jgi:hypothetical protein